MSSAHFPTRFLVLASALAAACGSTPAGRNPVRTASSETPSTSPDPSLDDEAPPSATSAASGRVLPVEDVQLEPIAPFVKMGAAWGDRSQGAHGTFGEFPGGAQSPPHTHGHDYHGVVISGVMTNPFGGEKDPKKLPAGSYWYVPANEEHVTACVSKEPCRFYFHSDRGFDFTPLEKMTKERSAGAVTLAEPEVAFSEIAPFVKMGAAFGDRARGAHGTFGEFKAGAASPPHTHTGAYHAVVISGVMTNPFGDEADPPEMKPGSYWHVEAGAQHVTACVSAEPCRFYFHADGAFDFTPTK